MFNARKFRAPLCLFGFLLSAAVQAQNVTFPPQPAATETGATEVGAARAAVPTRGMTMIQVEHQYGAPVQRHGAVGAPPITRWDYEGLSVYFEDQYVIHSVIHQNGKK